MTETVKNSILIVDDQESIIKSLKRLLMSEPYYILSAPDGQKALQIIKEHKNSVKENKENIFLIISDQRMPNMTGVQFLEKTVDMLPDAIRFILSGYSDEHSALNAMKKGIVHKYITKPWKNDELLFLISQAYESPAKVRKLATIDASDNGLVKKQEPNIIEKEIREFDQRSKDRSLGRMALHHGFINQKQLEESMTAMQIERQTGRDVSLENILFEKGFISSENVGKLVAATRRKIGKSFGSIAIKDYGVTPAEIERCFEIQAKEFSNTTTCRLLGDILVAEKILTEDQKDSIVIDMTYSEREILHTYDSDPSQQQKDGDSITNAKIVLNQRKKKFFKQRALDKIFCKSVINKNFATEPEVLKAFEEQLILFTKTFEIKLVKDLLVQKAIISQKQSDSITSAISGDYSYLQSITIGQNNEFEVTLSEDEMVATVKIIDKVSEDITADKLKKLLAEYQIVYGLADDFTIELFLKNGQTKNLDEIESFVIAKGRALKAGRNAAVKYFFEDHNSDFGKELDSGKFDYRQRAEMPTVSQGALLAEKIPLIPGINGITVRGNEIEAQTPVDIHLDCGKGAALSKDGLRVVAIANGRPDRSLNGKISVLPEIVIKEDVNFKTGNIKFNGDVTVNGTILAGFSVTANNLTVSDIQEAEVNIANTIIVKNSINDSKIKTGGTIAAQIIKKSIITAQGDVVVQKEIIDSTVITSGKVIVAKGRIVASTIYATKGIEAMNIGSDVSSPCHLFPGAENHALDMLKIFKDKIDSINESILKLETLKEQHEQQNFRQLNTLSELSKVQEQLSIDKKNIFQQMKNSANESEKREMAQSITDIDKQVLKVDEKINSLFDEHDSTQNRVNEIDAKIKEHQHQMQIVLKEQKGFKMWYEAQKKEIKRQGVAVWVQGTIFARTQISGTDASITLKNSLRNSKIFQVTNSDNPANPFSEMRIEPLTNKTNQPHVYRS